MPRQKVFRRKSNDLFKKVIELRRKEYSYTEIRKETRLAKSTIQNWLTYAGLTLARDHFEIQARKRADNYKIATVASRDTRKRRKDDEIQSFIQEIRKHLNDPQFVAGVILYEAEGAKGGNNGFSNSDFRLAVMFIRFLEKYLGLDRNNDLSFRLYIHDSRKQDMVRIKNFWSKKMSVKSSTIKVSWKHNVVTRRRTNLDYVGQLNIHVKGIKHFNSKILSVSDIILSRYQKSDIAGSSNGRTLGFGPRDF